MDFPLCVIHTYLRIKMVHLHHPTQTAPSNVLVIASGMVESTVDALFYMTHPFFT